MGFCGKIIFFGLALIVAVVYNQYLNLSKPYPLPELDYDAYWGPGLKENYKENTAVTLQQIRFDYEPIEHLRKLLNQTLKLQAPLEGTNFEYGVNSVVFSKFVSYWKDNYMARWISREIFFNNLPHYLAEIQGLKIHYIHTKATYNTKGKRIVPLLMLHGWPGSVREFYDIIPKLALPNDELDIVFEVVAPSLPGYGWSDGASKPGFGPIEMSIVLRKLMIRLGYEKFYVQGGDWGSALGSLIATIFPENVIGYHSNMCFINAPMANVKAFIASYYPSGFVEEQYQSFHFPMSEKYKYLIEESGYMHLQASKPDTIGIALTSNPIGLAAYMLEKFSTWTNKEYRYLPDGGLEKLEYIQDAILDNIMIYYLTNSITTSVRLYAEAFSIKQMSYNMDRVQTAVPTGCARFKHDLAHSLDWQLKDKFTNLIHSTYIENGGHFAALEQPDLLFKDFTEFVKKVEKLR